ncbi:hypothetical protein ACWGI1_39170 [Streptomyces sp. NPDC054835]
MNTHAGLPAEFPAAAGRRVRQDPLGAASAGRLLHQPDELADTNDRVSIEIIGSAAPVPEALPIVPNNPLTSPDTANKPALQLKAEAEASADRGDAPEAARSYAALTSLSTAYFGPAHEDSLDSREQHGHWAEDAR